MNPLEVGQPAPFFFLKTPYGVEVSLASCLLKGCVVVEFIRGSWDPDSRARIQELSGKREAFEQAGSRLLIIALERAPTMASYLDKSPTPLTVLLDEEKTVARSYGVFRRFALPVWKVAQPSTFVLDRCGFVRWRYVAPLSIHAATVEEVLEALKKLQMP